MASNFYRKTKDLFEEFQKRELHYMNTERIANSHFPTSDASLPVQEYLRKLNEREKETEDTYKNLMNHIEELDLHAERISHKINKLNLLKMSMTPKFPIWESSDKDIFQRSSLNYNSPLQAKHDFHHIDLNPSQTLTSNIRDSKNEAAQTDPIFCENCNFPFTSSNMFLLKSMPMDSVVHPLQNIGLHMHANKQPDVSEIITQASDSTPPNIEFLKANCESDLKHSSLIATDAANLVKDYNYHKDLVLPNEDKLLSSEFSNEKISDTIMPQNKILHPANDEKDAINMKDNLTDDNTSVSDSLDRAISKSDNESFNHEFDFLESDKRDKSGSEKIDHVTHLEDVSQKNEPNAAALKQMIPDQAVLSNTDISTNAKSIAENLVPSSKDQTDKKSESSVSIGGAHSPSLHSDNLSITSDSDSFFEKAEPPLKASAAYQALLGNVAAVKSIQKPSQYSESDSEDEIERALANAARKSSNIPTHTTAQSDKTEETNEMVPEIKPKSEPRKSVSASKSQQLSKNTRKVLGLDTSSGSEGEVKIQVKTTKNEEDSDEFDFYD